jgi:hypothetical protein
MPSLHLASHLVPTLLLHLAFSHHVVFKEIGKIAGAQSYIHAIVLINISGLAQAIHTFCQDVRALQNLYNKKRQLTGSTYDDWFHHRIVDLFQLASSDADAMLTNIDSLRNTLPLVAAETHLPHKDQEYQIGCLSPFAIVSGVVGTLRGWFTQRQLNNLRDRLDEVQDQQNRLLPVQAIQLQ